MTREETLKRIEQEAEKHANEAVPNKHLRRGSRVHYFAKDSYTSGAKSERNTTIAEAIECVMENIAYIAPAIERTRIKTELEKLKL